jgi:hypothetical protein
MPEWCSVFDEMHPASPANDAALDHFSRAALSPLTQPEIDDLIAEDRRLLAAREGRFASRPREPFQWSLPHRLFPASYLSFLRFSDGGSFRTGERWFDPFLSTAEVRRDLLAYGFPHWLPGLVPFALDGGGSFYAFDMRLPAQSGEYPIVYCPSGAFFWDDLRPAGDTFLDACSRPDRP